MRFVITVDVAPESGETINAADVETDLKIYVMDFAQTQKADDVVGGFHVTRANVLAVS
jgi:hypothetical protein